MTGTKRMRRKKERERERERKHSVRIYTYTTNYSSHSILNKALVYKVPLSSGLQAAQQEV